MEIVALGVEVAGIWRSTLQHADEEVDINLSCELRSSFVVCD